jgi:hypothetical protein
MKLGKGINYSRYCWQWRGDKAVDLTNYMDGTNPTHTNFINNEANVQTRKDIATIKRMGFDTLRLPITFHCWTPFNNDQIDPNHAYWGVLENVIRSCNETGLNLVISYHHAPTMNLTRVMEGWRAIANFTDGMISDKVVFEIFNEASEAISNDVLRQNYLEIIGMIKTFDFHKNRFFVVGGNLYNDIGYIDANGFLGGLRGFVPLDLPNIIYTFHYYGPKVFTNQGFMAEPCYQTKGISFPFKQPLPPIIRNINCPTTIEGFNLGVFEYENYDKAAGNDFEVPMGSEEFTQLYFDEVKKWAVLNNVTIWCGEWGFHRDLRIVPNDGSLERYIQMMIHNFTKNEIDWCWWDFEGPFTIFNPVPDVANKDDAFGLVECIPQNLDQMLRVNLGIKSGFEFEMSSKAITRFKGKGLKRAITGHRLTFTWLVADAQADFLNFQLFGERNFVNGNLIHPSIHFDIPTNINLQQPPFKVIYTTKSASELKESSFFLRVQNIVDDVVFDLPVEN